jgi:tripartite-type tricarboxylate transporter receptor subunit TctC
MDTSSEVCMLAFAGFPSQEGSMAPKIDRLCEAMQFPRRALLRLAASAAALPALRRGAFALDYPVRPVHIVAAYPPGTAPDIIARLIGKWLSDRLGQQFITDNRPGAASNIGTEMVVRAAPDGYTLLVAVSTSTINSTLYTNLNFNFVRDLVPVASIGLTPFIVVVNPQFPAKTISELIVYAKANPGVVNMATSGVGTGPHVAAELFQTMTGVKFVHVPYRGNYMPDLLSGQVPMSFAPMGTVIEFVRDGRMRALGVTPATRSAALPDVPAIAELLPGYDAAGWYGIVVPKGTPADIVEKLHDAVTAGVGDATIKSRLLALGVEPKPMSTPEFGKFIADETAKWGKVVRAAGIKPPE